MTEMSEPTIRLATPDDAPALLAIYEPYVRQTAITCEYEVPSVEEFAGRIERTLKRYPYLVMELDGRPVGYAYVSPLNSREAYDWSVETSIYLARDVRHGGPQAARCAQAMSDCDGHHQHVRPHRRAARQGRRVSDAQQSGLPCPYGISPGGRL